MTRTQFIINKYSRLFKKPMIDYKYKNYIEWIIRFCKRFYGYSWCIIISIPCGKNATLLLSIYRNILTLSRFFFPRLYTFRFNCFYFSQILDAENRTRGTRKTYHDIVNACFSGLIDDLHEWIAKTERERKNREGEGVFFSCNL